MGSYEITGEETEDNKNKKNEEWTYTKNLLKGLGLATTILGTGYYMSTYDEDALTAEKILEHTQENADLYQETITYTTEIINSLA